jgi:hypothetical protein
MERQGHGEAMGARTAISWFRPEVPPQYERLPYE